jgi:hypothetical protein
MMMTTVSQNRSRMQSSCWGFSFFVYLITTTLHPWEDGIYGSHMLGKPAPIPEKKVRNHQPPVKLLGATEGVGKLCMEREHTWSQMLKDGKNRSRERGRKR